MISKSRRATARSSQPAAGPTPTAGLSPAERARSIVAGTVNLRIGMLNLTTEIARHAVTEDGTVLFVPAPDSPEKVFAVGRNLPAQTVQASAQDLSPVPRADRLRGSVMITGKLGILDQPLPVGARAHLAGHDGDDDALVLALRPTRLALTWRCGPAGASPESVEVSVADYRAARPDPLLLHEPEWLGHLHADHADVLRALAAGEGRLPDEAVVDPLCLDRFGIVLRISDGDGHHDVRHDFEQPVTCACEIHAAFTDLLVRDLPG